MERWMALSQTTRVLWNGEISVERWNFFILSSLAPWTVRDAIKATRHVSYLALQKFLISKINNLNSSPRQLIFSWFSGKWDFSLFLFSVEKHEIKKLQNKLEWRRKVFLFFSLRTLHGNSWIKTLIWNEARKASQPSRPTITSISHPWAISFSERRIVSHIDLTIIQLFLGRKMNSICQVNSNEEEFEGLYGI